MEPRAAGPCPLHPAGAAQAMDCPYANGAYSPPYPPYASLPQPRGFCCSGPVRSPFPPEPPGPAWSFVPPEGPSEGSALRRPQPGPGYSPPQTPGVPVPVPQYPHGDGSAGLAGPRAPEDSWGPPPGYGLQPRYGWPTASGHSGLYVCDSHPGWTGSGAAAQPPSWEPQGQDSVYDRAEQSPSPHSHYPDVEQRPSGAVAEHRVATAPCQPRVQFSAQPQLYGLGPRPARAGSRPRGCRAAEQPEIQRILHVLGQAERLEEEVDEFVGKKTDKSYRLLEEMLTKLLLELDSIETGGQDSVRQARKESVHRIQAILEKLERKGL